MRLWPFHRRRKACPTEDARSALEQARRALVDAEQLGLHADDLGRRADKQRAEWRMTRERNHIAEAVTRAIRGA